MEKNCRRGVDVMTERFKWFSRQIVFHDRTAPKLREPVRVLIIDQDVAYARILRRYLELATPPVYRVTCCENLAAAMEWLSAARFDIALAVLDLPDSRGLDTLAALTDLAPRLPVILMSDADAAQVAERALSRGAEEYVIKGRFRRVELLRAIRYAIDTRAMQAHLLRQNRRLRKLVRRLKTSIQTDHLTGLLSRRHAQRRLEGEMAQYRRYGIPFSVIQIDVDDFKRINDDFGHEAGDRALKAAAEYIDQTRRDSDLAARFGGDEFLIILPAATLEAAESVCARLCARTIPCQTRDDMIHQLTLSVGAACAEGFETGADLLDAADLAMLMAKKGGKGRYELFKGDASQRDASLCRLRQGRDNLREVLCRTLDMAFSEIERTENIIESRRELMLELGGRLARKIDLPPSQWRTLRNAIFLTSFEKLNLCWEVLSAPGRLNAEQRNVLIQTLRRNTALLRNTHFLSGEADLLGAMYEWYDGGGFQGLRAQRIPLSARILGLLWAFSLLYIGGPRTPPRSREAAMACVRAESGTHFDPGLVDRLEAVIAEYYADSHDQRSGDILLVQEPAASIPLARRLGRAGYAVTVAETISDAARLADERRWRAIFIDYFAPNHTGLNQLCQIRRLDRLPHASLYVVSSLFDDDTISRARDAGADAYFVKPVRVHRMLKALAAGDGAANGERPPDFEVVSSLIHL